jgi:hypothetical protein
MAMTSFLRGGFSHFMVWLISHDEDHQHGNPNTRLAYALSETVGFSSLTCFGVGYVWLIFKVTS